MLRRISQPEVKAPWAISMAMLFTYVAGFLFNIVLCFCGGDMTYETGILGTSLAQPVAQLFYNSLGPAGGIVFTVCGFIIIKFVCFTAMVSIPDYFKNILILRCQSNPLPARSLPSLVIVSYHFPTFGPRSMA